MEIIPVWFVIKRYIFLLARISRNKYQKSPFQNGEFMLENNETISFDNSVSIRFDYLHKA